MHPADGVSPCTGAEVTAAEPSSSDSRGERPDPFVHTEEQLLGAGEGSYLPQPPLDREDALQAATVANLRAALMSKNSLLSLKADVLGDDSSLLFEYLPKGTHSLSRKFVGLLLFVCWCLKWKRWREDKTTRVTVLFVTAVLFASGTELCLIALAVRFGSLCLVLIQL